MISYGTIDVPSSKACRATALSVLPVVCLTLLMPWSTFGQTYVITTVAGNGMGFLPSPGASPGDGGPATSAPLGGPAGVALDASGNLYIADFTRVRKVTAATGIISTVAGGGSGLGDGGPATSAQLHQVFNVAAWMRPATSISRIIQTTASESDGGRRVHRHRCRQRGRRVRRGRRTSYQRQHLPSGRRGVGLIRESLHCGH